MVFTATNRKLRQLLFAFNSTLIPRPDFQRRLVWTNKDKLAFIDTVLKGFPFPEIYIASGEVDTKTGAGSELLVDGQQRITTLYEYFKGLSALTIPNGYPKYDDLDETKKKEFLEYVVVVRDLGPLDSKQIRDIFQRINATSYSLNAMEIHNARYDGALKKFGQHVAGFPFFNEHKIFSSTNIRRMHDVVFTLSIIITMISTYFHRDAEIESFLSKYNEKFEHDADIKVRLFTVLNIIESCEFDSKSRVWKKGDIFTLICELDRAIHKRRVQIDMSGLCDRLNYFYHQVDEVKLTRQPSSTIEQYYKAAIQATNDRFNRLVRGEILQEVIDTGYKSDLILLNDDSHVPDFDRMKEEMRTWFYENYENPVESCPYESREGGYIYIWGGPYDARDVISERFSGEFPEEVLEAVIEELESESWEWSAKPSEDDYERLEPDEEYEPPERDEDSEF